MGNPKTDVTIPTEIISRRILMIRGQKVLIDEDLADLYGVPVKRLNEAVRRNRTRFPDDFMFHLTEEEAELLRSQFATSSLRSQIVTSKPGSPKPATSDAWGGRRYPPYAFTEQGVAMQSSVLRSPRAVKVNIEIMRAFVRMRQMLASHADLAHRLDDLERECDSQFRVVFEAIRQLMAPTSPKPSRRIGFQGE